VIKSIKFEGSTRAHKACTFLLLPLCLSPPPNVELGILTWEGPPRAIFIPRFGGVAIFPFHSPSVTGNIRGGSLNRPSNTMAVAIRVAPLLALSLPLLFDIVRTTIWTRIHSDQNFTLPIAISLSSRAINRLRRA